MSDRSIQTIYYDARTVQPAMTGVGRYTLNLLVALAAIKDRPPIRAIFHSKSAPIARRDPGLQTIEILETGADHSAHPAGDWFLQVTLPRRIGSKDLFHGPAFVAPVGRRRFPRVITIHDLFVFTHPDCFPPRFRWYLALMIRGSSQHARRIIVPSESVASQLIELRLANRERIQVIHEAPDLTDPVWDGLPAAENNQSLDLMNDSAAILTVGTLDPRKDPQTARRGWLRFLASGASAATTSNPGHWIWFGGEGTLPDPTPDALKSEARNKGFVEAGHTSAALLQQAYRKAAVLVSCSQTEGFGLPLVEAMAAGCPMILSDLDVHREVAGDAALYFKSGDPEDLAQCLQKLFNDEMLSNQLRRAARHRSEQFSWEAAAQQTLSLYRECAP